MTPSPMIARLAEHPQDPAEVDPACRAWIAQQPGFCGGYHLLEPETGHTLSLTIWENRDALAAVQRAQCSTDGRIRPGIRLVQVAAVF